MSDDSEQPTLTPSGGAPGVVARVLHNLVSTIPTSTETPSPLPAVRAHALAKGAAMKAAALSGGFTLPPGPFGMATVLPDLLAVWRIQQQLVADIAAVYGRPEALSSETMVLCLFKHGGVAVLQRLLSRNAEDIIVQRIAGRTLQQLLEKIAVRVAQRLAAKSVSRWVPLLGAIGAGAYAYYDTLQVAKNAQQLFSGPLRLEESESTTTAPGEKTSKVDQLAESRPTKRRSARAKQSKKSGVTKSTAPKPKRARTAKRRTTRGQSAG